MSRKNHKMIDGRLLQTNKKYSQLKIKQKEKIAEVYNLIRKYPDKDEKEICNFLI